jgi:hypothetical protein
MFAALMSSGLILSKALFPHAAKALRYLPKRPGERAKRSLADISSVSFTKMAESEKL